MNVSRNFALFGTVVLLAGMVLGVYMSVSGDHTYTPVHAHTNLAGGVLSLIFAVFYRVFGEMAASKLAAVHFWLHTVSGVVLLVALFLLLGGFGSEATLGPVLGLASAGLILATLSFLANLLRNVR